MLIGAVVTSRTASSGAKPRSTPLARSATCSTLSCASVGKRNQRTLLLIRVWCSAQPKALHTSRSAPITSSTSSIKKVRDGVAPVGGELRGVALGDEVRECAGGPVGGALGSVTPGDGALGGGAP